MTELEPWRPGSQAERTALAWIRTSVSILAVCGAATRLAIVQGQPWGTALGSVAVASCLASILLWRRRASRFRAAKLGLEPLTNAASTAIVAAVASVCCVGVVVLGVGITILAR